MNKMKWKIPMVAMFFFLLMTSVVEAHVTVIPSESQINAWEKYTVRVPVEKDINTTEVELEVPEGINLVSVLPMDSWDYELKKDDNDLITSVTWIAKDEGIGPNEFIEFFFIGANPAEPGEFSWEAYQTYEDGSVVEWVGAPDSDEPASVSSVVEVDSAVQQDDDPTSNSDKIVQGVSTEGSSTHSDTISWFPIVLASIAILLAIVSLFRKRA